MNIDSEKILRYCVAGAFGILGFSVTYIILGFAVSPIQDWLSNKIRGLK